MMRDEVLVDRARDLRRVDGVGRLADPVGDPHRTHLNGLEEVLELAHRVMGGRLARPTK
jgi:hypothetical protein